MVVWLTVISLCLLTLLWQHAVFHNNKASVKLRGRDREDNERAQQIKIERERESVREGERKGGSEGDKETEDPPADSAPWTVLHWDPAAHGRNKLYPQKEKPKALLNML